MKWLLLGLFYVTFLHTAEETPFIFQADEAIYDGTAMTLSGHVLVEHEAGSLTAGQAILHGSSQGKRVHLQHVDLYDHVLFDLSEGGNLSCAEAHLNQEKSVGEFRGSSLQPFVVYMEECRDASGSQQRLPLIVKSRLMTVEFKPSNLEQGASKSHVNAIMASDQVTVDYNHDFIAAADVATFHREDQIPAQKCLSGIICLEANENEGHCYVTNRNGDLVHAHQIFVDTQKRRLTFARPKGALFREKEGRIDFSSDTLNWEEQRGALNLRGHVTISDKGFGQLTTDDEVTLFQVFSNGKRQLSKIESTGHTVLKTSNHLLKCPGQAIVDHAHLKVTMVSSETQVFYEDEYGSFFADRVDVKYEWVKGEIKPSQLNLEGHVKMLSKPKEEKQQFALADKVEVFPESQEAFLSANEGERVLVVDQVNDMQVSAKALKIKRDESTKKESVQGVGDVRFHLLGPELEQIQKRFEKLQKYGSKDG